MGFRYLARSLYGEEIETLTYKTLKNTDFREVILEKDGKTLLKFAIANGFRNIQNLVQKLKRKRCDFDFVEVLACPSGCVNGGAQLRHAEVTIYFCWIFFGSDRSSREAPLRNSAFIAEILQVGFWAKYHLKHVFSDEKKCF